MRLMISTLLPFLLLGGCARETEPMSSCESALALEEGTIEPEVGAFVAYDTPTTRAAHVPGEDRDGDGFVSAEDPDDDDPLSRPALPEVTCNEVDEDLDGVDLCPVDGDGDGFSTDRDCDDADPGASPLTREVACDGRDQNCDGHDDCDAHGDMVVDWDDADPADPSIPDRNAVDANRARLGW